MSIKTTFNYQYCQSVPILVHLGMILIVISLFCISSPGEAQTIIKTRNIVINAGDSTVKTTVWNRPLKYKPETEYCYYWYNSGKINQNYGGYSGRLIHGIYEVYDFEQHLLVKGKFEYGLKTGEWIRWHPNGNVQCNASYENGMLDGSYKTYTPKGELTAELYFKKGILKKSLFLAKDKKEAEEKSVKGENNSPKEQPKIVPTENKSKIKGAKSVSQPTDSIKTKASTKKKWWQFPFLKSKKSNPSK